MSRLAVILTDKVFAMLRTVLIRCATLGWIALACIADRHIADANAAEPAREAKRLLIFDDDLTGPRGSVLMPIQSPQVELLGITVVSGGAWRDEEVAHTLRMLELIGRTDIPVVPGAVFPLVNTEAATKRWEALYGRLVYKGAWMDGLWPDGTLQSQPLYHAFDVVPPLPEGMPTIKPANEIAANFMIRQVHAHPGQVSIVATGPLTNLALAQRLDPSFAANVKELVVMGGSFNPQRKRNSLSAQQFAREFENSPRLEFNFRFDPEAASIVFRAPWKRLVLVPVDPSTATELTAELVASLTAINTPLTRTFKRYNETGFPLWDEIAMAVWLDPTLAAESDTLAVDIDTSVTAGYGNTLSWPIDRAPHLGEGTATIVRAIDVARMEQLMARLLNATTPKAVKPLAP